MRLVIPFTGMPTMNEGDDWCLTITMSRDGWHPTFVTKAVLEHAASKHMQSTAAGKNSSRWKNTDQNGPKFVPRLWSILKAWIDNPTNVATICPSSPYLTERLADRDCVRDAKRIIELGPGTGGTTRALLSEMRTDSKLLAIEKTASFGKFLRGINDPRLAIEFADACDLTDIISRRRFEKPDIIIAGIPFSVLGHNVAKQITQSIHEALRPGGTFIAYQLRSDIRDYAQPLFGPAKIESIAVNLPPLRAYVWTKAKTPDMDPS